MDLQPRGYEAIVQLIERGVTIPNPLGVDIGEDVDVDRISGDGETLWPGCRIHGAKTVISAGCTLGAEGPVTLVDCRLGPKVALNGGSFRQSVFLEKASMGLGAQVREGCLLEEEANGAHTVGLKQTILFPFVTLGSLINFCDCLMAGGTSRKDHSEVGSSYIHFNYTPNGDKTTASLFGDVPRGVMLNQPAIFLGGQGGAVGPVSVGYGTVVAAGSVLLNDVPGGGKLVAAPPPPGFERDRRPNAYGNLVRVVRNNVVYLANLMALESWYREVRRPFFARQELGDLVYEGALEAIALAKKERVKRLMAMSAKVPVSTPAGHVFSTRAAELSAIFIKEDAAAVDGAAFLAALHPTDAAASGNYLETMQGLASEVQILGTAWLQRIVDAYCEKADELVSDMNLFDSRS
jgi:UDP-N-acetylglucosamine/UDP-N-acetylgalactosamine diphosphorylase